jgi:hypothetical protein
METNIKKQLLSTDEIIRRWKESREQSKIESEAFAKSDEYKEIIIRLRAMKSAQS